jgi:tRNA A-37 threonylcarbamoyl transferase component Bud32
MLTALVTFCIIIDRLVSVSYALWGFLSLLLLNIVCCQPPDTKPPFDFREKALVTLNFTDGSPVCNHSACIQRNHIYFPFFACADGNGVWRSGIKDFRDPVPPSHIVTQVNITLFGRWKCNQTAQVLITLQDEFIYFGALSNDTESDCECSNCASSWTYVSQYYPDGWPGYHYGQENQFWIYVSTFDICLSQVQLWLTYERLAPKIEDMYPLGGPMSGGTTVLLVGQNFVRTGNLSCCFGNVVVPATFMNHIQIACTSPSFSEVISTSNTSSNIIPVKVSVDGVIWSNASVEFYYYEEPQILQVVPNVISAEESAWVDVWGSGFIVVPVFKLYVTCKLVEQIAINVTVINSTYIMCEAPPSPPSTGYVSISLNRQQYTKSNVSFSFENTKAEELLAWAVVCGTVFVALGGVILVALVSCRKRDSSQRRNRSDQNVSETTPLMSPSLRALLDVESMDFEKEIKVTDLELGKRIGKGSFGEVYLGRWRGTVVAIKKLPFHSLDKELLKEIYREVTIMKGLRHPNVLQFLGACTAPPDIYIVTEFMSRGSLYNILHDKAVQLSWQQIKSMAIDAAKGMAYLHNSNPIIIHRDLKSQNLLVDDSWRVKVCDFGLSRIYKDTQSTKLTACGTPCWTAPEVLRRNRYSVKADVYSFGVVLWEMISREEPFKGMPPFQVIFVVATQGQRPTIPSYCPPEWEQLIEDCWQEDPDKRPTFEEIIQRLEKFVV